MPDPSPIAPIPSRLRSLLFVPGDRRGSLRLNVRKSGVEAGSGLKVSLNVANTGTETWADARAFLELGLHLSFAGMLTYANKTLDALRDVAAREGARRLRDQLFAQQAIPGDGFVPLSAVVAAAGPASAIVAAAASGATRKLRRSRVGKVSVGTAVIPHAW